MNFREFIEKEEEKLFDEGIDEVFGSALKFLGGAGGNLISQTGRAAANITAGVGQGVVGAGQGAVGALQMAGGGWKKGRETLGQAGSNLSGGLGKVTRGIAQAGGALTGISPILRGAQAASEPLGVSGVYAPGSKNRNYTQDLLGLDSWEKPSNPKQEERPRQEEKPKPKEKPQDGATSFLKDLEKRKKSKDAEQPTTWKDLVLRYRSAKSGKEREQIRKKMRILHPDLYMQAVEAGKRKKKI